MVKHFIRFGRPRGPRPEREVLDLRLPAAEPRRREDPLEPARPLPAPRPRRGPHRPARRAARALRRRVVRRALAGDPADARHQAAGRRAPHQHRHRQRRPAQPLRRRRHRDHPRRPARQPARQRHPAPGHPHRPARRPGDLAARGGHRDPPRRHPGARAGLHRRQPAAAVHRPRHRDDDVVVDDARGARQRHPPRAGALPAAGGRADVLRLRRRAPAVLRRRSPSPTSPSWSTPRGCSSTCPAPAGSPTSRDSAIALEPAFPMRDASVVPAGSGGAKRNLFFYSRPLNARNLFWRGAQVIARAVEQRILDPDEWEFHFVGRGTPELTLPRDVKVNIIEGLGWTDYQDLVASMDAALVLMDTPHPSYPPYDLASVGAAVLTNSHGIKTDLSDISDNIVVAPSTVDGPARGAARDGRAGPRPRAAGSQRGRRPHQPRLGRPRWSRSSTGWSTASATRSGRGGSGDAISEKASSRMFTDLPDASRRGPRPLGQLDGRARRHDARRRSTASPSSTARPTRARSATGSPTPSTPSTTPPARACARRGSATTSCAR